jgi:signal transduction histidine kinase
MLMSRIEAQNRGVYPLGMNAVNSGLMSAPGFTYTNQLLLYARDEAKANDGPTLPIMGSNTVVMDLNTIAWSSETTLLGGKRAELALRESRQELRALAGRLIGAEEQERKRISCELHDDLNQKLAFLAFDADDLRLMPFSSEDKVREQLVNLKTRIVELSQHVREISHRLHPSILDDLGLTAALEELSQEFSARERLNVEFTQEAVPPAIPTEVAACLYRVAQEALHNVLKHAQADYVRMSLSGDSRGIHLSIHDTGVGFDSEAELRRPGLGIVSMNHGEFSIHSQPGQGTEVRVSVPLPKE